jgi:hypothetical protein
MTTTTTRRCFALAILPLLGCVPPPDQEVDVPVETGEHPFLVGNWRPWLTENAKHRRIHIDMTGPALPAGAARTTLRNDIANAVAAWLAPMRTFSPDVNPTVLVTACDDLSEPSSVNYDCLQDHSYYDKDARRVIVERLAKRRKPTMKVVVEPIAGGRSFYCQAVMPNCPEAQVIHLAPTVGFQTILHEFGHAFGLNDVYSEGGFFCDIHHGNFAPSSTSVMCNANFAALQMDDTAGIQHLFCKTYPADCNRGVLSVEQNQDRPGFDYDIFDVGNNFRLCYDRCAREARCRAYTFVPPGVQGPSARCYLKGAIPAANAFMGMVSGYKP